MKLYSTAVKNPVATALCFVAVIIFGLFSFSKLSVDLLPKMDENAIMVMTIYPGAGASDVENNVTRPLENVLNGVSNLKNITSSSRENASVVGLEFEHGIDIESATNDVRDKLDLVKSSLPDDVENPIIFKFGADDIPIMLLSVTADRSTNALYKILDDKVGNPLARINGVGTVSISGTAQREINVYCDPYKLEAYGLTIETVTQVIGAENRNTSAGNLDMGNNTYTFRVEGEFTNAAEMLDLVVGVRGGKSVFLRDVAKVEDHLEERAQESYTNGKRGATIMIQKQSGANSVKIAEEVKEMLPKIQKSLPSDIELGMIMDNSTNILNTMGSLAETIMITMIIVFLVVFIFLGRWKATLIIITAIPISLITSFIYLLVTGNTLNVISLSALSLAIGMVVDDSIVVLENITTHIQRGSTPRQAAIYGTREVSTSVMASALTMLSVFLPLTMISGMAGILFRQLGWIVSIIMAFSFIASMTLIPMMASKLLKLDHKKGKLYVFFFTPVEKGLEALNRTYERLLNWGVNHRKTVVFIALGVFGGSLLLFPFIKTEFFPASDNGRIGMTVELPIGTRQSVSQEVAMQISDEFMIKYPEIKVLNFTTGQADADNAFSNMSENGSHIISYNITLKDLEDRKRGMKEICDLMRDDLALYDELKDFEVLAGGQKGGTGGESAIDVEIYGYNFDETDKVAANLTEYMKDMPECSQVNISRGEYVPEIQVDFDREKLALNELNISTVSFYLRNRIYGAVASYYREDGEEYKIKVRFAPEFRETVESIENIMVYNNVGKGIRIRDVGKVVEKMTPPTIERKNRERVLTVSGIVAQGYAMSDLVKATDKALNEIQIPENITCEISGSYKDQQETFGELFTLLALIIVLVFIVMASQFGSLSDPFVIMFSLPFALTGVILGHVITGTAFGVMSLIGVLVLVGVVVKNGIVLVDYIKLCIERGMDMNTAVITAGKSRLRPVLMTSLTTILGMLPMAIGIGEGSEMWQSMGMTVACGLFLSLLITLILVPVIYCLFNKRKMSRKAKEVRNIKILESLTE